MTATRVESVVGCLLGAAVGDALGLCCEGLSPRRQRRLYPDLSRYHFLPGRGMVSDDTEHACMTAQALLASGGDAEAFARDLAWRLRFWLLALPAGVGLATARGILKLWLGWPLDSSGVFSAGNGPCMRSALLGVLYGDEPSLLRALVRASTRLTHTDPRAEHGALAVALAAATSPAGYRERLGDLLGTGAGDLLGLVSQAAASASTGEDTEAFAVRLGLRHGVTGYVNHTVPVVLHAWFRHPADFRSAVLAVIRCGGDTDTTASILGGIVGARVGKAGIPGEWLDGLWEWPRSAAWIERLGVQLATASRGERRQPPSVLFPAVVLRNLLFLLVVLGHGFRRLLPPY